MLNGQDVFSAAALRSSIRTWTKQFWL